MARTYFELRGCASASHDTCANEQNIDLASQAVSKNRVQECGDEGKGYGDYCASSDAQHSEDQACQGNDETNELSEGWWLWVFKLFRRR